MRLWKLILSRWLEKSSQELLSESHIQTHFMTFFGSLTRQKASSWAPHSTESGSVTLSPITSEKRIPKRFMQDFRRCHEHCEACKLPTFHRPRPSFQSACSIIAYRGCSAVHFSSLFRSRVARAAASCSGLLGVYRSKA